MSKNVKEINGAQLEALIKEGKTVVCDFWAPWCGPCRMIAPVLDELAPDYAGRAEFVKINVDEDGDTAQKYGVMSIPNIFVIKGGAPVANSLGYVPAPTLKAFLDENL